MRFLISGAGPVGFAMAKALIQRGVLPSQVTLIERGTGRARGGAAMCLPANGVEAARNLGWESKILQHAWSVNEIFYGTSEGDLLSHASLKETPLNRAPFVALPRATLLEILEEDVAAAGVSVQYDRTVKAFDTTAANTAVVTFNTGAKAEYDVVINAEGMHSQLRSLCFPKAKAMDLGITTWRFLARKAMETLEPEYLLGPGSAFMRYPISKTLMYCYAHMIDPDKKYQSKADLEVLFAKYAQSVRDVISATLEGQLILGRLETAPLVPFSKGPVVLIGDALHGCSPLLQQGCALGFDDAFTLAYFLEKFPIKQAFEYYEEFRKPTITAIVNASNVGITNVSIPDAKVIEQRNAFIKANGPINILGWRELLKMPPHHMRLEAFMDKKQHPEKHQATTVLPMREAQCQAAMMTSEKEPSL